MTKPNLGHSHVLELRRQVKAPSTCTTPTDLEKDLTEWGLLTWDGGGGKVAKPGAAHDEHERVREPACLVTTPGHAFLRGYELGCQRLQAATMTAKAKAGAKPKKRR